MRVVRLREPLDFRRRHGGPEHAAQVVDDHAAPKRQQVEEQLARPAAPQVRVRSASATADALVRSCVSETAMPGDARAVEDRLRVRAADDLRRAVAVARDGEVRRLDAPGRELARKELHARFLRGVARGEARRAPGPVAAVGELLRGEDLRRARRRRFARAAARCARSRRVSMPQRTGACAAAPAGDRGQARAARAPAAPRRCRRSRGRGPARHRCAAPAPRATPAGPRTPGSSVASVAMPGTDFARSAASAIVVSTMPAAAIRCPIAHLNAVTGGHRAPNTRRSAAASEASDCAVPLPCATIMPTSAGADARVGERRVDRARDAVAVVANREQPGRFADVAAAEHFAEDRRVARARGRFGFERERARAFAEHAAAAPRHRTVAARRAPAGRTGGSTARSAARSACRARSRPRDRPRRCAALRPPRSRPACRRRCDW